MGTIHLVRHGQASFGAADYDQLSSLGEEQARSLGHWISDCGGSIPVIAAGTQKRHLQSAEACAATCQAPDREAWHLDAGFNEFDHRQVLVRHRPEFADPEELNRFLTRAINPRRAFQELFAQAVSRWVGGGYDREYHETYAGFRHRAVTALRHLISDGHNAEVWVFTSGGVIVAIVQELLAIPDNRIFELNWTLINTGVTRLLHRPGRISVSCVNSQAHLERLRRPELITYR